MSKPEKLMRVLDEFERALEDFRVAYTAWLAGHGDHAALARALEKAEERLDAARAALASAD